MKKKNKAIEKKSKKIVPFLSYITKELKNIEIKNKYIEEIENNKKTIIDN